CARDGNYETWFAYW
nr:immunoglobulin heavy chain junction region [Mus musculus]